MLSRRKHFKSRHGCSQCKAAHSKCDLAQPTCGKCMKAGKSCQFPNLINARSSNTLPTLYDQRYRIHSTQLLSTIPQDKTAPALGSPYLSELENVLWDDLELLHYFSTVTYATLACRKDLRRMWQVQVPKMALKQKFLMHSLFSVTALHMGCSHPENQSLYINRAIRHHNIALWEYSFKLQGTTRENSTSVFTCAILTVVFAFSLSMLMLHRDPAGPIKELLGIFMLLRGAPLVLGETWNRVRESEIAPLFVSREPDDSIILSDDVTIAFKLLEDQNQLMSTLDSDRHTYALAIQGLKQCYKLISSKDRDDGMVFSWPISVSQEYIALLFSRQQMALVILAHYAVILNEIKTTWWVMGWGSKLIEEVHEVVKDEWKSLVVWPMERIAMGR